MSKAFSSFEERTFHLVNLTPMEPFLTILITRLTQKGEKPLMESKLMGLNFFILLASFSFGIRVIIAKLSLNRSNSSLY